MEPDNSKMIEMQKQQILNKMKYLRDQTLKYRDEINKFEQVKKYLEEENMRLMQEQKERELLRANKQKQMNEPISYKDTETKTFYTGRVQQKYSNSGQAFDERYSYNKDLCQTCGKIVLPGQNNNDINNPLCLNCGKIVLPGQNNNDINNQLCQTCGKIVLSSP